MKLRLDCFALLLTVVLCAPLAGCGDDSEDDDHSTQEGDHDHDGDKDAGGKGSTDSGKPASGGDEDELEVAGDWESEFGEQSIGLDDWDGAMVVEFDNDENVAFTEYPEDAMFGAGTFSKLVWTEPNAEGFYYCTVDFGLESLADAKASEKTADADSPEDMGSCGEFAWTKLKPR
jgi:hypothetical protein